MKKVAMFLAIAGCVYLVFITIIASMYEIIGLISNIL